jgi:transcriptional regulator with XRE-family HTH domain
MDSILAVDAYSSAEISRGLAERARERRLTANLTQAGLATRAGVSLGSLKRFERTGEVSLERMIRIALALGANEGFDQLFARSEERSLDEILATPQKRHRGHRH